MTSVTQKSKFLSIKLHTLLAPIVQKLDSAIHRINRYPADKWYEDQLRYAPDSD